MDVAGGLFCFLESLILPFDIKKQNGCSWRAVLFFGVTHFILNRMDVGGGLFFFLESLILNRMDVNGGLAMSHSVFNPNANLIDAQTEWLKQNGGPIYLCLN